MAGTPQLLCVTVATSESLPLALVQRMLWGAGCDEHLIYVTDGELYENNEEKKSELEHFIKLSGVSRDTVIVLTPSLTPSMLSGHYTARNTWQRWREVFVHLASWGRRQDFDFVLFVEPDNYVIPENLHKLISDPAYSYLHHLGTPLYLGNRMDVPGGIHDPDSGVTSSLPFVAVGGGIVLNRPALRLLASYIHREECYATTASDSVDVLLASCLDRLGVIPRDAADAFGQDRFHVLSPLWIARHASDNSASWWYSAFRRRPQPTNPLHAVSESSVTFHYINTVEKALIVHRLLFPSPLQS